MSDWEEVTPENNPTWEGKEPITGKLVEVKSNVGSNNSMLYVLETADGRVSVWGSTVLDTKFAGIVRNSMVKIEPLGKVKSEKSSREYYDYKVFVKPPGFEEVSDKKDVKDPTIDDVDEKINLDDIPF